MPHLRRSDAALILVLTLALAGAAPAGKAASPEPKGPEWTQYRGNSGFTGVSPDASVRPPLRLLWSYRTDGDTCGDGGAGLIVAGGKVFVPISGTNSVLALDADTGQFRWQYGHADFAFNKAPAYHDGRLYVWRFRWGRSAVVALNAADGQELWTKVLKAKGVHDGRDGLAVSDGRVYCPDGGDEPAVVALDAKTGNQLWRRPLGTEDGPCVVTPCAAGGLVFAGTRANFNISKEGSTVALDAASGEIRWRVKNIFPYRPAASDGQIVAISMSCSADLQNYALDAKTGATLWVAPPFRLYHNGYKGPAILADLVLLKPYGNIIFALDRKTGKELWQFDGRGSSGCCPPSVSGSYAYYGTGCSTSEDFETHKAWSLVDAPRDRDIGWIVRGVDLRTGKEAWRFPTGDNTCGEPAIAYGRLYFSSRDGYVYCFAPAKEGEAADPEARDKSPNASAEEVRKLLAPELADRPRPGRDWSMWGGTPDRSGLEGITLQPPLTPAWKFDAGGRVLTAAAIRDGRAFFGSDSGKIFAVDLQSGQKSWEFQTGAKVRCSPAAVGGMVYCGSDDGRLYALDTGSGQKKWAFECGGPVQASPAVSGGVVVFSANDYNTYALDRKTGKKLWSFRGSNYSHQAPPVIHGNKVFAAQWLDWARALDLATGKELWKTFAPLTIEALACHGDRFYLRTPIHIMEYDPATGKRLRMGNMPYGYGGLGFARNLLFASGNGGGQGGFAGATALDPDAPNNEPPKNSDGKSKIPTLEDVRLFSQEKLPANLSAMGAPLGLGDKVCFATIAGEVILTALNGKTLWSAKLGGTCHAPPVAADGTLVVGCDDGNVYAFREKGK
jgi:outer membrane protein assembly factor BamB